MQENTSKRYEGPDTGSKGSNVPPKKLMWQLYLAFMLIMIIPALLYTWYTTRTIKHFFFDSTVGGLTEKTHQIGSLMEGYIDRENRREIDSLCKVLAHGNPTRFTVIAPDGMVLGDSEKNPALMENHGNRMEVIAAKSGKTGVSERYSNTLKENMVYVAGPITRRQNVVGIIRLSLTTTFLQKELNRIYLHIVLSFFLIAVLAALASYFVSRRISLPVDAMKKGAQRIAAGDFSGRLSPAGCVELDELSIALNEMAQHLQQTIYRLKEHHNRINAVLSSMVEGVIAVDNKQHIITINRSAVDLFSLQSVPETGVWIGEVLRNVKINDFVSRISTTGGELRDEAVVSLPHAKNESGERVLQLHGNILSDANGEKIGVLVVLNDITRLNKLETMRSDFVANVSHELRTPLTSIKGFVETLQAGAINDTDAARRFLEIITRQVERLSTIVEDLLALSRLEEEAKNQVINLQPTVAAEVIASAVQVCTAKALKKDIKIATKCDTMLSAFLEPALIEEAVINLIDNAVNYSPPGERIMVMVEKDTNEKDIVISVTDNGPGIPEIHHNRIFERFYRVDKARSRKLGGTGLGLSIVKHIVLLHGGSVTVKSAPGKGSRFSLHIPVENKEQEKS